MSAISVRDARASDAQVMAHLCTQLGYRSDTAAMPARLERFADDRTARVLVAESVGEVVGMATVHLRYTLNHDAPIAQLTLLVVDETQRTRGAGRTLVGAIEAWARERGSNRLVVTTALERAVAHTFYERLGFTHTGRRYGKDFVPRGD